MLALQLPMNRRPIRLGVAAMAPFGPVIGVKRRLQVAVAHAVRQRPTQPGALETPQRPAHRRGGHAQPTRDFSRWKAGGKLQTNDLARLAHRNSFRWHRSLPWICQRRDPKQASGGARRRSIPRAGLSRYGGRHHLVMVGGIIPLRRATSSRYDGRLGQESALSSNAPSRCLSLVASDRISRRRISAGICRHRPLPRNNRH